MKEIKLKCYHQPYLAQLIRFYEGYGYKLLEIRPTRWYELGGDHIAIMGKDITPNEKER